MGGKEFSPSVENFRLKLKKLSSAFSAAITFGLRVRPQDSLLNQGFEITVQQRILAIPVSLLPHHLILLFSKSAACILGDCFKLANKLTSSVFSFLASSVECKWKPCERYWEGLQRGKKERSASAYLHKNFISFSWFSQKRDSSATIDDGRLHRKVEIKQLKRAFPDFFVIMIQKSSHRYLYHSMTSPFWLGRVFGVLGMDRRRSSWEAWFHAYICSLVLSPVTSSSVFKRLNLHINSPPTKTPSDLQSLYFAKCSKSAAKVLYVEASIFGDPVYLEFRFHSP